MNASRAPEDAAIRPSNDPAIERRPSIVLTKWRAAAFVVAGYTSLAPNLPQRRDESRVWSLLLQKVPTLERIDSVHKTLLDGLKYATLGPRAEIEEKLGPQEDRAREEWRRQFLDIVQGSPLAQQVLGGERARKALPPGRD